MSAHGDHDMGHTVAGWTGSALGILAALTAGLGLILASTAVLLAGLALAPTAALVTWLLHLTGWGKPTGPRPPHLRPWRTRDRTPHPQCLGCRLARPLHRPAPARDVLLAPAAD
ncbi:HGxxPAAW family protein [Streptomyces sp. TLI_171]|uniref:HGxxPAAW family protein n=1 Tax=Streptomyces sp. TLI_171 TaxID=1938859 RepID=UPI000C1876D3|nr:HGxxPAAW family protein [Streptomyces sp. TLI_171]RKE17021.1 hypothetical protein BX266_0272 [Streptomyces sp. TLI_171]